METPDIKWEELPFGYVPTDYNVRCTFKDGKWGEIEVSDSEYIPVHIAATCLHYGQESFEGLKAFRGKDGKVRVFRMEENARRFIRSAEGIKMEPMPEELFCEMVRKVVRLNERFIPPYGTGASLYIRPFQIGMSARVGVKPADEYMVAMLVTPVGPYFKTGFKPCKVCLSREYDRVAPKGTGSIKIGGNYAASLVAGEKAHDLGYAVMLYLDPKEKKYLDECGAANFFGIRGNSYITPDSESILPSITNKSIRQIAEDLGMIHTKSWRLLKKPATAARLPSSPRSARYTTLTTTARSLTAPTALRDQNPPHSTTNYAESSSEKRKIPTDGAKSSNLTDHQ